MTNDLLALADWLRGATCGPVVMESTGSYWRPAFNVLEGQCDGDWDCLSENADETTIADNVAADNGEDEEEDFQDKPRRHVHTGRCGCLLSRSVELAPFVDGLEKDLPPGETLILCFRPFIEHLAATSLSTKAIRQHVDNLWSLGGEIIRELHYDSSLRKKSEATLALWIMFLLGRQAMLGHAPPTYLRSMTTTPS